MDNLVKPISKTFLLMVCVLSRTVVAEDLIDLSYSYDENTAYWPTGLSFGFINVRGDSRDGYWYAANDFKTAEHCGTHLDAPYHFNDKGWKTAEIPLNRLITTGFFLNVSMETKGDCNYKLPSSSLIQWESQYGPVPNNSVLLISFGWASRYNNKSDYFGPSEKLCFPGISKEASEWITNSKKIVGVGVDTPSVDQGLNVEAHMEFNSKNLYMLENVNITKPLPHTFKIIALPMKIAAGTGGPCRVVVVV